MLVSAARPARHRLVCPGRARLCAPVRALVGGGAPQDAATRLMQSGTGAQAWHERAHATALLVPSLPCSPAPHLRIQRPQPRGPWLDWRSHCRGHKPHCGAPQDPQLNATPGGGRAPRRLQWQQHTCICTVVAQGRARAPWPGACPKPGAALCSAGANHRRCGLRALWGPPFLHCGRLCVERGWPKQHCLSCRCRQMPVSLQDHQLVPVLELASPVVLIRLFFS